MAILICKGTRLESEVAGTVLGAIAQVISFTGPGTQVETFQADYLDQPDVGIPVLPTGRALGGEVSFDLWLDPALAGHKALLGLIEDPAVTDWAFGFSDNTEWPFEGIFKGLSATVDLADGLKGSGAIELSGIPTYP